MYTVVAGPKGSTRYKKDNHFIKRADIPADILIKLEVGMVNIDEKPQEPEVTKCIFCGMATKGYRLLNQKPVYVCMNDYYDKTMGQIAQKVRQNEQSAPGV